MTPPLLQGRGRPHAGRRIVLISPYPPSRTGPAEYAAVFASQCAARGFEVRVLAERTSGSEPIPAPPEHVTIDPVWTRDLWGMRRLYLAARNEPAEVVHVNYTFTMFGGALPGFSALVALGRLSRGRPLVVTLFDVLSKSELTPETLALYNVHASPRTARLAVTWILRYLVRVADRIVVQSPTAAETLRRDYRVPAEKIAVTELPGYPVAATTPIVGPTSVPSVLYFGFLAPYKGVEMLLAAFARARATAPSRRIRLIVAGGNHPRLTEDFGAKLVAEARRLGLDPTDVTFPGYVDDEAAARLFAEASLVVLPYLKTAGSSGTLASAMGAGRNVVVTDLPNLVGQLNGYAKSRVVRPGDVSDLADTIRSVAEGKFVPRPPKAVSQGGTLRWEDLVDRTADIYSSAIAERRATLTPLRVAGAGESD